MSKKVEQGARLSLLLQALKMSQSDFATVIHVSPGLISQITGGKKSLSNRILSAITIGIPQVNVNWLMDGSGTMFRSSQTDTVAEPMNQYKKITLEDIPNLLWGMQQQIEDLQNEINELKQKK